MMQAIGGEYNRVARRGIPADGDSPGIGTTRPEGRPGACVGGEAEVQKRAAVRLPGKTLNTFEALRIDAIYK